MSAARLSNAKTSCKNMLNAFIHKNERLAIWQRLKQPKFKPNKHLTLQKLLELPLSSMKRLLVTTTMTNSFLG